MGTCFGRPAMQSIARLEQWRRVVIAEVVLPLVRLAHLLQLTEFSFKTIKYWSGFADDCRSKTLKCSANTRIKKILIRCLNTGPLLFGCSAKHSQCFFESKPSVSTNISKLFTAYGKVKKCGNGC